MDKSSLPTGAVCLPALVQLRPCPPHLNKSAGSTILVAPPPQVYESRKVWNRLRRGGYKPLSRTTGQSGTRPQMS